MTQLIATIIYVAGIVGLFYLDRDRNVRTSWALWIPTIWMLIIGSRRLSDWFNTGPMVSQEQGYLDGNPINVAVFGVLIAAGVVVLSLRSRRVKGFLRGNAPLLLFFAYCALSTVWSDYSSLRSRDGRGRLGIR
jgi:carbon starvation protein CstA